MRPDLTRDAAFRARFRQEVSAARTVAIITQESSGLNDPRGPGACILTSVTYAGK